MNRILLVMPYEQYVRQAQEAGFWVVAVWDPKLATDDYLAQVESRSDAFVLVDFDDRDAFGQVLRETARRYDVRWIYHIGREDSMLIAGEVAEELGMALNPTEALGLLNDKLATRTLLASSGISPVRYEQADDVHAVRGVLRDFGYPAVVKPTSLSGSRGVFLLRTPEDVDHWATLVDTFGYPGPYLVEEQLVGPEFSVESLSYHGHHTIVGVTAKEVGSPPLFVETGHIHPAPLSAAARHDVETTVLRLLELAGYQFGPAHTEVILTRRGPRIVESQARLGGDQIHRLVELATGLDIESMIFTMLAGSPPPQSKPERTARIRYLSLDPGVVTSIDGVDRAGQMEGVDEIVIPFDVGDLVPVTRDSKTRHGYLIVVGSSVADTEWLLAEATSHLRISTSPYDDADVVFRPEPGSLLTRGTTR